MTTHGPRLLQVALIARNELDWRREIIVFSSLLLHVNHVEEVGKLSHKDERDVMS